MFAFLDAGQADQQIVYGFIVLGLSWTDVSLSSAYAQCPIRAGDPVSDPYSEGEP